MLPTISKLIKVALVGCLLSLTTAAALSADTATPDDTARFLAGLPPSPDSPLVALAKNPYWQQHANYFNVVFARKETEALSKVRAFSNAQLTHKHDTMLYMFGGPDFLYATSLFPTASTYVLAGLEPPGEIPQLTTLPHLVVARSLQNLENSLHSLLGVGFFITSRMQSQLHMGPVYGTLPVLYVFLARTGKTIHEMSYVNLDNNGEPRPPIDSTDESALRNAPKSFAKGVRIVFSDGDGPRQTLYYFSTDLTDTGLMRSGFLKFLDKFSVADSLVKSASYLLHGSNFSSMRNFLLDHSAMILQDDTGVPVIDFDPQKWRLKLFGHYFRPIPIFRYAYQARMAELYRKGNPTPIDFGIGYRYSRNQSNLLLAEISTGSVGSPEPK